MGKQWSDDDIRLARELERSGMPRRKMLAHFPGRSKGAVQRLLQRMGFQRREFRSYRKTVGILSFSVAADIWDARDRRANEPRTLTGQFFGDPAPSQSALGRPCE